MKKYLFLCVFILSFVFISFANATSINLESTQTFYPSQWIVESRPVSINITDIVKDSFSLILPKDTNIRFSSDFSSIKFSWVWSSKIWTWITIMPNLRVLKFSLLDNLVSGDNLTLDGLKLVIYSKPQWDRYIWIDLNWDNITEAISFNWYRVNSINAYSDTLASSEVFNLTWSIVDNKLTVSADMPWDVDFQAVVLENRDSAWKVLSSFFRYDLNKFSYDLQEWFDSIRVKTVDIRANYSKGLVYKIDDFRPVEDNNICIQVISYAKNNQTWDCETFSTPCDIPNWYTQVDKCEIKAVEKYSPTYKRFNVLYKITWTIDNFINTSLWNDSSIEKTNKIMTMRNNLIKILERLDTASASEIYGIADEFKALFSEIKVQVK